MEFKNKERYKSKDAHKKELAFLAAYEFAKRYVESEGFKLRFRNKKWMEIPENYVADKLDPFDAIAYLNTGDKNFPFFEDINKIEYRVLPLEIAEVDLSDDPLNFDNAYYNPTYKSFGIGDILNPEYSDEYYYEGTPKIRPTNKYLSTLFHEFGHWADDSVGVKVFDQNHPEGIYIPPFIFNYSTRIPVFRFNNDYQAILNSSRNRPAVYQNFWSNPEMSELPHDARPSESYADLIEFRALLDRFGIYDSTKVDNPFTLEHLDWFRKLGLKCRLESLFSDDLIIWMMNNVADASNMPKPVNEFNLNLNVSYT